MKKMLLLAFFSIFILTLPAPSNAAPVVTKGMTLAIAQIPVDSSSTYTTCKGERVMAAGLAYVLQKQSSVAYHQAPGTCAQIVTLCHIKGTKKPKKYYTEILILQWTAARTIYSYQCFNKTACRMYKSQQKYMNTPTPPIMATAEKWALQCRQLRRKKGNKTIHRKMKVLRLAPTKKK